MFNKLPKKPNIMEPLSVFKEYSKNGISKTYALIEYNTQEINPQLSLSLSISF